MITQRNLAMLIPAFEAPGLGRTVLAIDDDRIQLGLVRAQLQCAGFVVVAAENQAAALEIVKRRSIDAVLSDVVMAEGDGFSLCRLMRDLPALRKVPIVLISADFRETADRALARSVGASDLVQRSHDLQEAIEALVLAMAEGPPPSSAGPMPDLYNVRIAHQLVELRRHASAAEARYEIVFEHASDAISIQKLDGTILDVNRRWEEIQQRSRDEMVGRNVCDMVPPEQAEATLSQYLRMVETGEFHTHAVPIPRPDGKSIQIEFTSTPIDLGGDKAILSIGRDVTDRVEAERKLAASERKYRTMLENIPDVVWSATPDLQMTFLSPNILKACGFTAEEVLAGEHGPAFDRVHPDDLPELVRRRQALVSGSSEVLDAEYRWRHRDGHYVWFHVRALRAHDGNGQPCIDGVFSDITQRKTLEEQLHQAQKLEAVGRLTAGIAHDFNNILAVISANSEFLLQELDTSDERRQDALEIKEATVRAAALTRQLLSFSRRQVHEPRCVDLRTIVVGVQKMLDRVIGEDVALAVTAPPTPAPIHADPGKIEQVLMNLVINARDAMPNGGGLIIDTENLDVGAGGVNDVIPPGRWVVLTVRDTGTGMSEETRSRIFEPFFTTKDVGRGTGLGLSTSYGIVHESGGHIVVESELGKGTTFKVFFPRVSLTEQATTPALASAPPTAVGTEAVLVVEDNPLVSSLVRRILSREGYDVTCVTDGAAALAAIDGREGAFDLVVSDMALPGMNGPQLIEELRARAAGSKALLMSGHADHAALRAARDHGIPIMEKPFAIATLLGKVREALDT